MLIEIVLAIITLIAYAFYRTATNRARYFEERNLKHVGMLTALQNLFGLFLRKADFLTMSQKMYNTFPDEPVYGSFDFSVYQYIVRDPEVYKRIAIKDFDHFADHRVFFDENADDVFGNSLITLQGEKWRQMRATLSPAFTGSKMRLMFELISECADDIVAHYTKKAKNGEKIDVEMKDFFSRYANDVIATCAFGLKVNSFADPENEFYMNGKKAMSFGTGILTTLKFLVVILAPKVAKILKIRPFDSAIKNSFRTLVFDTMAIRKEKNIYRPDMINILMQVREGNLTHQTEEKSKEVADGFATVEESDVGKATVTRTWTDNEVLAQCLLFFFAGFDTTSTMLTFAAYELVANPDVQQKLYEEIADVNERIGGKRITYDALQKMKYLDQVICESLRKWPAAIQTDRSCIKDYIYDDGKLKFKIEKGSNIVFSLLGIQRDPKYFPNPDKFDPERFSDENKDNIVSGTYLPFGAGPRNCIGSRFALMELKAILYYLLLNFSFEVNKDTQIPLKMEKGMRMATEKGVHLELRPRSK